MKKLNLYSQNMWHDEALLLGDRASLQELKEAIDEALDKGKSKVVYTASDKRKYDLVVKLEEDENVWERVELPYKEEMAKEEKEISKNDIIGEEEM